MPVPQCAQEFASSIASMVRVVLANLSASERLIYLDALNGLNNEWSCDDMQAREELGMMHAPSDETPPW